MNNKLIFVLVLSALAAGCGGESARGAGQQQYETVQEGSAPGVTTSIAGPGETLPPLTGTNADTTTAFALDPKAVPPGQAGGTDWTTDPAATASTGSWVPPAASTTPPLPPVTRSPAPARATPPPTTTTRRPPPPPRRAEPAPPREPEDIEQEEPARPAPPSATAPPPPPTPTTTATTTTNPPTTTSTTTTSPETEPEEPPGGADAPDETGTGLPR